MRELPKFIKGNAGIDKKIEQWLWLISGKGEKIEMAKKKNNKVEEAMKLVKEIMQDPKELEIYESIQKARMDYNSGMRHAREEGEKKR